MEGTNLNNDELGLNNVQDKFDFSAKSNFSFLETKDDCFNFFDPVTNLSMNNAKPIEVLPAHAFPQDSMVIGENGSAILLAINEYLKQTSPCIEGDNFTPILSYISIVFSIICFVMILVGNGLILLLGCLEGSIRSPVFYILRSLSAISILSLISFTTEKFLKCEIINLIVKFDYQNCYIDRLYKLFSSICENAVLYHLLLLTIYRISITAFPLRFLLIRKRQVCLAIVGTCALCVCIQIILDLVFTNTICKNNEPTLLDSKQIFIDTPRSFYQITLLSLVFLLLIVSMVISVIQTKLSSSLLQTTSQRRQSKVASIVITTFTVFYIPLISTRSFILLSCPSTTLLYVVLDWLPLNLKYAFYAFNPIILFLRQPSIRSTFLEMCKRKTSKKRDIVSNVESARL